MVNKKPSSTEKISELKPSYFELQSYIGVTKHMGGLKATRELIELCHITKDKYLLVVGCGDGRIPCYISKKHGCGVVGIDISERMINRSNERAKREGVENIVKFSIADAHNLPFEDDLFDVVIGESITTFLKDKQSAISEYVRVIKAGGYVGLNEETWVKIPPPTKLIEYISHTFELKGEIPTPDGWVGLLQGAGLKDIIVRIYKVNALSQWINEIRLLDIKDLLRGWYRFLSLCFRS